MTESAATGTGESGATGAGGIFGIIFQFIAALFGGGSGGLGGLFQNLFGGGSASPSDAESGSSSRARSARAAPGRTVSRSGMTMPDNARFNSSAAFSCEAGGRGAGNGRCGEGVYNILSRQGFDVTRGNGHDWARNLRNDGWVRLEGVRPEDAPVGAVLTYTSDVRRGRAPRNGRDDSGGDEFGHVEIVARDNSGNRRYIHSLVAQRPGGTVPDNFTGAYVTREHYQQIQAANRRTEVAEVSGGRASVARNLDAQDQRSSTIDFNGAAPGRGTPPEIQLAAAPDRRVAVMQRDI